jgi:hypothetical protein
LMRFISHLYVHLSPLLTSGTMYAFMGRSDNRYPEASHACRLCSLRPQMAPVGLKGSSSLMVLSAWILLHRYINLSISINLPPPNPCFPGQVSLEVHGRYSSFTQVHYVHETAAIVNNTATIAFNSLWKYRTLGSHPSHPPAVHINAHLSYGVASAQVIFRC